MFFNVAYQIIYTMAKTAVIEDVRDLVSTHLKTFGIKQTWLAQKLDISDTHLTLIFQKERDLTENNLNKINSVLGTDFKLTA